MKQVRCVSIKKKNQYCLNNFRTTLVSEYFFVSSKPLIHTYQDTTLNRQGKGEIDA